MRFGRFRPDILKFEFIPNGRWGKREGERRERFGTIVVSVVDIKSSARMKISHQMQVICFHIICCQP